jgi:endogenous inhibitor of DNA gyrase (YacG/DUF329 family)
MTCKTCGAPLPARFTRGRPPTRCERCRRPPAAQLRRCPTCGDAFTATGHRRYCTNECKVAMNEWLKRVPCAGGCGRMLLPSGTSLPAGEATCRPCRLAGRGTSALVTLACGQCGDSFQRLRGSTRPGARPFCSVKCRNLAVYPPRADGATGRAADRMRCAKRRARFVAAVVEVVDPDAVFERDGWLCHLCGESIDRALTGWDRMGPTVDHLIPLVAGGEHSYANVAAAHRSCNSRKGASLAAPLAPTG